MRLHQRQQQGSTAAPARSATPARLAQSVPRPQATPAGRAPAATATAHQAAAAVLVQDGQLVRPAPPSAQALLSQHGSGSYTTALVRGGHSVVDWHLHISRLVRNTRVLSQRRPPAYAAFTAWLQQQTAPSEAAAAAAVEQLILPSVTTALQHLAAASACEDAAAKEQQQQQAMLVVLLTDPLPSRTAPAGMSRPPLLVLVWAKPLSPAPADAPSPAAVLVAGRARPAAHAKHCEWVAARQPLEALRQQAGVDEVVLLNSSSGALLEGLVTNFYVLADATAAAQLAGGRSDVAEAAGAASGPCAGLVVLTTGPQHRALRGVMQQRVVQACSGLGLPVLLQPARLGQQAAWRGAFLTNSVRGVQAVSAMQLPGGEVWQPPDSRRAEAAVVAIRRAVVQVQEAVDVQQGLHIQGV